MRVRRTAVLSSENSVRMGLDEMEEVDEHIDGLDADEGNENASQAVDEQVAAENRGSAERLVDDAPQGQRDQRDDDQGVENDRAQDRAEGRGQVHDVERGDGRE